MTLEDYAQAFAEWMNEHPEKNLEILKVFSRKTIRDISSGRKPVEKLPTGQRIRLYDITGLKFFSPGDELEYHPKDLDMKAIIKGDQPRSLIAMRIEYDGKNFSSVATELGVTRNKLRRYLDTEEISESAQRGVESLLIAYYARSGEAHPVEPETTRAAKRIKRIFSRTEYPNNDFITQASQALQELKNAVDAVKTEMGNRLPSHLVSKFYLESAKPTLEERIDAVATAISVLADQTNYFREATKGERLALADSLDMDEWGYVAGILPRINQKESFETVMRLMPRPTKSRGKRK
ncbi:hypothetical protein HY450_02320 [Candidatus Pacearchaeota archaeon]|nr:hypothetical protein [Candidatus Pacearchaeota archaeon]